MTGRDECADYVLPDESYTNADQPVLWEEPEADIARGDFSHLGELWLEEGDGDWLDWGADRDPNHRTRKPRSSDVVRHCRCGWPLAIRWKWSACEFGEPRAWRTTDPAMESVLDDDALLYRVAPWLWTFCRCNGCVGLGVRVGRPPTKCLRCDRLARNTHRRNRYAEKVMRQRAA